MSDKLAELTRRVEALEVSLAGVLQRLAGDEVQQDDAAENRRRLFELLSEAFEPVRLRVSDLSATLGLVVDRLNRVGVRAPHGKGP